MKDTPNFRRMLRTSRLLADLGHDDTIEALKHMQRMRIALRVISVWTNFPPVDAGLIHRKCADALALDAVKA